MNFKKFICVVLTICVCFSFGISVSAKSMKLSKSSISMYKGKTKIISISNVKAKAIKNVTIKVGSKKVASVKKVSKTKYKVKGTKVGKTNVTFSVKYKKGKKLVTKKLVLKVKVKKKAAPDVAKHHSYSDAVAVIPASTAKLVAGMDNGSKKTPEFDKENGLITGMTANCVASFTVPDNVSGQFDIYIELGKTSTVAGESMYSLSVNDGTPYCLPAGIKAGDPYELGTFLMGEGINLKTGDVVNIVGNPGFVRLPYIGNMALYKSGSSVAVGYDSGKIYSNQIDESDPISGKTIAWLGSSVTYGYGSSGYSMADAIRDNHSNTKCYKYAISGTTLVNDSNTSYVARMKNDIDPNMKIDMLIVQLSTNDASQGKPMGELSESMDPKDFDDKTIIGAIETIIAYGRDTWHCPVVFYTGTKYNSENYANMVTALYDVAKKWEIDVIDLWGNEEMSAVVGTDLYKTYMKDSIHPKLDGYVKWWTPKFEDYLKNHMN